MNIVKHIAKVEARARKEERKQSKVTKKAEIASFTRMVMTAINSGKRMFTTDAFHYETIERRMADIGLTDVKIDWDSVKKAYTVKF